MALPINELKQLMLATAKASQAPAANFSFAGKELSVIAFRKKVNFSLLEEEEVEEKEVITSFTANIEDTIPAWVRQVENMKKNRK